MPNKESLTSKKYKKNLYNLGACWHIFTQQPHFLAQNTLE